MNNLEDFSGKNSIFLFLLRSWKVRPPLSHLCSLLEPEHPSPFPAFYIQPTLVVRTSCLAPVEGCVLDPRLPARAWGWGGGEKNTAQETGRKVFKRKHGIGAGLSGKIRSPVGIQSASESGSENQGFCLFIQSCLLLANCSELGKR